MQFVGKLGEVTSALNIKKAQLKTLNEEKEKREADSYE
jgi:hypothetical protein